MRCGRTWALSSNREAQTFGGESLFVRYVNFVKLPHTVFALPFALLGVIVASYKQPVTWRVAILVIVAFTAARFVAMGFNRIADRRLDARNPRTQGRELRAGRPYLDCHVQLHEAVHRLDPSVAGRRARDRAGGWLRRDHRRLERAVVAAPGDRAGGDLLGGGVRRLLRAAG